MKPILRQLPGLLLMCAGLGLTTLALAMLWLAPEVFVASARVAVTPPSQQPSNVAARGPGWTPTEVELIQAKRVLFQVITNLDLQRKWAEQMKAEDPLPMDKAYQLLKKQLTVLSPICNRQTVGLSSSLPSRSPCGLQTRDTADCKSVPPYLSGLRNTSARCTRPLSEFEFT
jgi:hypothetical protein